MTQHIDKDDHENDSTKGL